ncbi:MAG: hypothetical protein K2G51_06210 [Lachnospiraceae bacterium]|nr:hypothetical protein [Lachnospiraceae bacterium]
MKKKLVLSLLVTAILGSSITVCAAPQYMADGAIFDPEWYLEQNPDVAAWEPGASADALYQHYTIHGAKEGRAPYDALTLDMAGILPYQGTSATTEQQPIETEEPDISAVGQKQTVASSQLPIILMRDGKQLTDENTIMAVEGESYALAWHYATRFSSGISLKDDLIDVTFRRVPKDSMDAVAKELLAPYMLPGYEWRQVQAAFVFDPKVRDLIVSPELYVDGSFNWNSSRDMMTMEFSHTTEYPALHQIASFAVNYNGVDYQGCAFCATGNFVGDGNKTEKELFILVPEGYSGSMSIILPGYSSRIRFDF